MLKLLKNKLNYLFLFLFLIEVELIKFIIFKTPKIKRRIKRKIRKKIKSIIEKFQNPKTFYLYKFYFLLYITLIIKPTPKNLKKWLTWCTIKLFSIFRSSYFFIITANFNNKNYYFYLYLILICLFIIKSVQEIYFNFTCPLATFIYGKYVRRKRLLKIFKKNKQNKTKLHKFVADPFYTKEQKKKKQDAKEKIEKAKMIVVYGKLNPKKKIWILEKPFYKEIDPRILNKKKWYLRFFKK